MKNPYDQHWRLTVSGDKAEYIASRLPELIRAPCPHSVKCVIQNCLTDHNIRHDVYEKAEYVVVTGPAYNERCNVSAFKQE